MAEPRAGPSAPPAAAAAALGFAAPGSGGGGAAELGGLGETRGMELAGTSGTHQLFPRSAVFPWLFPALASWARRDEPELPRTERGSLSHPSLSHPSIAIDALHMAPLHRDRQPCSVVILPRVRAGPCEHPGSKGMCGKELELQRGVPEREERGFGVISRLSGTRRYQVRGFQNGKIGMDKYLQDLKSEILWNPT